MEATPIYEIDFEAELRRFQQERSRNRSKGRHLSECIHHIVARLDPKRFSTTGPIDPAMAEGGFIWEDVISFAFARRYSSKQLELQHEGIFGTLDDFSAAKWRVIEYKMTKMSAVNPIRSAKFLHWHMQIMGYCEMVDSYEAELVPLFVNGSYELGGGRFGKPVVGKDGHPYLLRFTPRERRENWEMILRARDWLDKHEGEVA